jgi:2-methylcitrate dehydratase
MASFTRETMSTKVERMAEFVANASYDSVSPQARDALKLRVLDSLAVAFGALGACPVELVRAQVEDFGGAPHCTLIGGGRSAPDRAALYNGLLVRYLDFNDSYLAPGETCHPSDNVAPVLAAAEYANASGRDCLAALAVAYQVQCRLSDLAPVRAQGFDHTVQGQYAVAAGVARALGLAPEETANAIAIAGTAYNALRVTRTGELSHWKGLAYPGMAFAATHAAFLAMRGITGPREVFEGNKGFQDSIAGDFELDWSREDLEAVTRTAIKRYNAEIHAQSALEAAIELREENRLDGSQVERVELDTFQVAYDIIGGGEEGKKTLVRTKEEADHSLPYMLAVALLDGQVLPDQYLPERIAADDVQALLRRVEIRPNAELSRRFPAEHCATLRVHRSDGRTLERSKRDYLGYPTRPIGLDEVVAKLERLAEGRLPDELQREIVEVVKRLDEIEMSEFIALLARADAGAEHGAPQRGSE